jgi:hypothetical protein
MRLTNANASTAILCESLRECQAGHNQAMRFARLFATLSLACALALLNQLPKLARLAKLIVFCHRQFAAEKKIAKRVFVQNAMHGNPFVAFLEINTIILGPIPIEPFSFTLDQAKSLRVEVIEIFW